MQVKVNRETSEEETGQSTDSEEEDKAHRIEHRGIEANRTLVHRCKPVEDLNGGRDTNRKGNRTKDDTRHRALTTGEHVVSPYEEAEQCTAIELNAMNL